VGGGEATHKNPLSFPLRSSALFGRGFDNLKAEPRWEEWGVL